MVVSMRNDVKDREAHLCLVVRSCDRVPLRRSRWILRNEADRVAVRLRRERAAVEVGVELAGDEVRPDAASDGRTDTLTEVVDQEVGGGDQSDVYRISKRQSNGETTSARIDERSWLAAD